MSLFASIRKESRLFFTAFTLLSVSTTQIAVADEPVGFIDGSLSVEKGVANYSIQIAVPPGRGGMEPTLSIGYSSMAGSGLLGYGWNLSGLSAVTRCGSSIYQDGFNRGVKLDSKDNYCLDGQRLVPIKGANGANGTEYRTELESFSRIVSYGSAGTGPEKFKVWSKSGLITEYGFTEDSRGEAQGKESVLNYYVNRISDTTGKNHIRFNYIENTANTEINISSIEYGPNYRNKVLFTLGSIPKEEIGTGYRLAGSLIKATKRINKIETFVGEELVQSYIPTYVKPKDKPYRLTSIKNCDANNNCLKPVNFDWVDTPDSSYLFYNYQSLATLTTNTNPGVLVGDFNADGIKDLIIGNKIYQLQNSTLKKIADIPNTNCHRNSNNLIYLASSKTAFDNSLKGLRCAFEDMNNDGMADVIKVVSGKIYVALSKGTSLGGFQQWGTTNAKGVMSIADMNGDSYNDIFFSTTYQREEYIIPRDNSDKVGIRTANKYSGDLLLSNGSNLYRNSTFSSTAKLNECENCFLTDVNGDGYADLIRNNVIKNPLTGFVTSQIYISLSTGSKFSSFKKNSIEGWKGWNGSQYFQIYDVDGNGLKDLVASKSDRFSVAMTGGESLSLGKKPGPKCYMTCVVVDVNNDGLPDLVKWSINGNQTTFHVAHQKVPGELQLVKIHSNVTTEIEYADIHDSSVYGLHKNFNSAVINSDGQAPIGKQIPEATKYPNIPFTGRLTLVKSVSSEVSNTRVNKTSYQYSHALINQKGLGSLGFKSIKETDEGNGLYTVSEYSQTYPYVGQATEQETRLSSNNRVLNRSTNSFKTLNLGKTKFPYTHTSVEKTYKLDGTLLTTSTVINESYDRFGNLLKNKAITTGNSESFTVETSNTYKNYLGGAVVTTQPGTQTYGYTSQTGDRYLLSRLSKSVAKHTAPNGESRQRVSTYEYNTTTGLLTREQVEPGNANSVIKKNYHDGFGNVTRKDVIAGGVTRTSKITFDANGQYPIKETNNLGFTSTAVYEPKYGNVIKAVDINGLVSTTTFDGFGNPVTSTDPNGKTSEVRRYWASLCPHNIPNAYYCVESTPAVGAASYIYHDRFDREIRKVSIGLNGKEVHQDTEYNTKGLVSRVSRAYYPGNRKYWAVSKYDILDRVVEMSEPAYNGQSAKTRTIYDGFITTVIDPTGAKKTSYTNAQGNLIKVEEELGASITYAYDPLGNLVETKDDKGNKTLLTYDLFGNKTQMNDPDMGIWKYEYNGFGELIKQTDAKGQVTTMQYDQLGRLVQRSTVEGSDKWVYDTRKKGLLTSTQGRNSDTSNYYYDSLSRVSKVTKKLNNKTFSVQTSYDGYGRLTKEVRPNSFQVSYDYDSNGYLTAVKGLKSQAGSYPTSKLNSLINTAVDKSSDLQAEATRLINLADSFYNLSSNYYSQLKNTTDATVNVPSALKGKLRSGSSYNIYKNGSSNYIRLADENEESNTVPFVFIGFNNYNIPIALPGYSFLKINSDGTLSAVSSTESRALFESASKSSSQVLIKDYNKDGKLEIAIANNFTSTQRRQIEVIAKEFDSAAALLYKQAAQLINSSSDLLTVAEATYRQAQLAGWWDSDTSNTEYKTAYTNLKNSGSTIYYWQAKEADAEGRITRELLGNGLSNVFNYDPANGLLLNSQTAFAGFDKIRDLKYQYNLINSVTKRADLVSGAEESFNYDKLDRLTKSTTVSQVSGQTITQSKDYRYDTLGNITFKTGVGSYVYGSSRPHAVTKAGDKTYSYDANGNMTQGGGRTITWSSFNKPTKVVKDEKTVAFKYDADRNRFMRSDKNGTTLYFDKLYEHITKGGEETRKQFIYAGGSLVAINVSGKKADGSAKPVQTRYMHRDNLGSVDTITDQLANVVEKSSFDPFGSRRMTDWRVAQAGINLIPILTNRGFTGHEHMDDVGLIHMNGRVYDAELGRFLSADPHIQSPSASQSYNRYSYVMNNPLKYTDPTGYFLSKLWKGIKKLFKNQIFRMVLTIVAVWFLGPYAYNATWYAAAGAAAPYVAGAVAGFAGGFISSGGDLKAGLQGALLGAISAGIGNYLGDSYQAAVAHGVVGGINAKVQGGKFAQGFFSSAFAKIATIKAAPHLENVHHTVKAVAMGIIGGTTSVIGGGKFGNAALTSSFQYLLNHALTNPEGEQKGKSCSGQMCRPKPKEPREMVSSLSAGVGLPLPFPIDGKLHSFQISLTVGMEEGAFGGRPFFDLDLEATSDVGLLFATAEWHEFMGTYEQYDSAVNISGYLGLGGGALISPDAQGVSMGVGFGGKWVNKVPYAGNLLNLIRNKGLSGSVDTGL